MSITKWADSPLMQRLDRRLQIVKMIEAVRTQPESVGPESCEVRHHFAHGSYGREIHMPAGLTIVGKIHKHSHVNVISRGIVWVFTEHNGVEIFSAPYTFVSQPGTQRVVHILEDTVWTTIHVTDKTNLADIERGVMATNYSEV